MTDCYAEMYRDAIDHIKRLQEILDTLQTKYPKIYKNVVPGKPETKEPRVWADIRFCPRDVTIKDNDGDKLKWFRNPDSRYWGSDGWYVIDSEGKPDFFGYNADDPKANKTYGPFVEVFDD